MIAGIALSIAVILWSIFKIVDTGGTQRVDLIVEYVEFIDDYAFYNLDKSHRVVLKNGDSYPCDIRKDALTKGWLVPYEPGDTTRYRFTKEPLYSFTGLGIHETCSKRNVILHDLIEVNTQNCYLQCFVSFFYDWNDVWAFSEDIFRHLRYNYDLLFRYHFCSRPKSFTPDFFLLNDNRRRIKMPERKGLWLFSSPNLPKNTMLVFDIVDGVTLQSWDQYPAILTSSTHLKTRMISSSSNGCLFEMETPPRRLLYDGAFRWDEDKYLESFSDSKEGPPQTEEFREALSTAINSANLLMRQTFVIGENE